MPNNKTKILAILSFIAFVATFLTFTPNFSVNADGDEFVKEIADYKTWQRLNNEPIKVEITLDFSGG